MTTPPKIPRRIPTKARTVSDDVYPGFLGTGWSFPPTFSRQSSSVVMVAGDDDIQESLWIILATRLGERIMQATFGCNLSAQVFIGLNTSVANEIATLVSGAITEWEPRVTIISVTVTEGTDVGYVNISIDYMVRQTNSRSNLVFPYYLAEATLSAPIK